MPSDDTLTRIQELAEELSTLCMGLTDFDAEAMGYDSVYELVCAVQMIGAGAAYQNSGQHVTADQLEGFLLELAEMKIKPEYADNVVQLFPERG
jgi:hypothetical protein